MRLGGVAASGQGSNACSSFKINWLSTNERVENARSNGVSSED